MKAGAGTAWRRNLVVGTLTAVSITLVAVLAYWSSSSKPPSASQATLLTVFAAIVQILSSTIATGKNRADPNFVKSAIARLVSIGIKSQMCEKEVQIAFENGTSNERRIILGKVSVTLSYLQEETRSAIQDWTNLHPDLVEALIERGEAEAGATNG